ncbi:D-alanyl-D-alanine carboxypeptidase family protein [Alkaliphilus oremlandii]|uniref:Peptidase M15B and M15C DD-carboxypeptidase VanY/endolysin n=1 Tax=Alkaliphilus oremlandii (strain OhILAs) TaxID=350688 RepID=A8MKQ6_ALKOO|nr:D-alanyl-D-alanine carboxypeptidase family protein [Alkaliphilus oremlandii]ABW20388.1 peptidase M15B and M15C DD-carboxypeptidase VanY/endolysin [Alkaliphilus oremlandii OhILAs]
MKRIVLRSKDIYRGNLILINQKHPIQIKEEEIIKDLTPIGNCLSEHFINKNTAKALQYILNKINSEDRIIPVSGFRSRREQIDLYKSSVRDNGLEFTQQFVAKPDESEHQSGMAIDLGENKRDIDFICPDFPYNGVFNKFREEAKKCGFIERYKEGKESITGISKEPWHFRYVGYPHSVIIEEKGFALEEYHDFIKNYTSIEHSFKYKDENNLIQLFFVKSTEDVQTFYIEDDSKYEVSGNNQDGFIITLFKNCS